MIKLIIIGLATVIVLQVLSLFMMNKIREDIAEANYQITESIVSTSDNVLNLQQALASHGLQ